ncbi:MAG: type 4a pilus biogenesis protein PilO [Deltaproteobacteria bacterium]|nr:type 4a pilus biogenesis protein PilO [Deltaproteobacteria bacterium]
MPLLTEIGRWPALEAILNTTQNMKKGHRILVLAGTLLILGGAFFFFVYMPYSTEISRIEQDITGLKQRITLTKAKARNLEKFRREFTLVEKRFKQALRILPDKREIPSLLAGISELGTDSNLQVRLFSPGKEAPQDFYVKIPVTIEVGGKYRDVALFFDKVRRMDRIVNIMNITMKPKEPLSTDLITKCTAVTYRFMTKAEEQSRKKSEENKK